MVFNHEGYKRAIENEYTIVNKEGQEVNFILNSAQADFISKITGRDYILKARQLGFSAEILAIGTTKFIFGDNERCVSISHETSATQRLLDRVKYYIGGFEARNKIKIPLKYNSRSELVFDGKNNSFYIGTAGSHEFGRGDTITFLHLSEFNFYPDPEKMLAGIMQAVVPNGLVFIESTANGFNYGKEFWDKSVLGETGFATHFYSPQWEYTGEQLEQKKKELGRIFPQEYPMTAEEAFLTSGEQYFDSEALRYHLTTIRGPMVSDIIYA